MGNTTMSTLNYFSAALARRSAAIQRMSATLFALSMLGFGSALARTDTNTVPYAESFENLTAWGGVYTNVAITNGWYADLTTDQSVITNLGYTSTFTAACGLPLPSVAHANVLQLNTGSATLTNSFGGGFSMSNTITYMDTMVFFVTSDQTPSACTTNDAGIKAAVYVDTATTNLVVYHGINDTYGNYLVSTNEIIAGGINTAAWYRLTIVFDATCVTDKLPAVEMFQVKTNGVAVQSPNAYNDGWKASWQQKGSTTPPAVANTGTWFRSATAPSATSKTLTAIAFQGSGFIDDLVVATAATTVGEGNSFLLTVVNNGNGSTDFGGTNALTQVQVAYGTSTNVVYSAGKWFEIAALYTNGINATAAQNASIYTQQLVAVNANVSNNVTFYQPTNWVASTVTTNPATNPGASGRITVNGAAAGADVQGRYPVLNGSNLVITYTADTYSRISDVNSNGADLFAQNSPFQLTLGPVVANMTAAGTFVRDTWTITNSAGMGGSASPAGNLSVLNGLTTNITYTANDWQYTIATAGAYGSVSSNGTAATVTFGPVLNNTWASATFAAKPVGAVVSNVPSSWALGMGLTEAYAAANSNAMQQGYMLNLNPTNLAPGMGISSIDMRGTTLYVTVLLQNNGTPVSTNINGTVTLLGSSAPLDGFTTVTTAVTKAFVNGTCEVPFANVGTNRFYRAEVTYP